MDKKEIARFIGKRITAARENKGYSQKRLAEELHVNQTRLSNWEVGEVPAPVEFIPDLARILDVSVDYLLGINRDENGDIILEVNRESLITIIKKANREEIDQITKIVDIVIADKYKTPVSESVS